MSVETVGLEGVVGEHVDGVADQERTVDSAVRIRGCKAAELGESLCVGSQQHKAAEGSLPSVITMQVRRSNDQIARLPVKERLWVELRRRSPSTVSMRIDTAGRRRVADVEQRELHADLAATSRWRLGVVDRLFQPALPDTEQQVLTDRVQVAGVAGDLERRGDLIDETSRRTRVPQ
jgi:hypothetical protein